MILSIKSSSCMRHMTPELAYIVCTFMQFESRDYYNPIYWTRERSFRANLNLQTTVQITICKRPRFKFISRKKKQIHSLAAMPNQLRVAQTDETEYGARAIASQQRNRVACIYRFIFNRIS